MDFRRYGQEVTQALEDRLSEMTSALEELVSTESPSDRPEDVAVCLDVLAELAARLTGAEPAEELSGSRKHLVWRYGSSSRVLLIGHADTVWPRGTIERWPFSVTEGRATGPGVFDMKAGLLQIFYAIASLKEADGIEVIVTSDEEIGSETSRVIIEEAAERAQAALVLEPSLNGALKTSRKGISNYQVHAHGRAAHAGLDPTSGVNAALELAYQLPQLAGLARGDTTVTPTLVRAGTTRNTVPALATCSVDVRVGTVDEQNRVDREIKDLSPHLPGATIEVVGGPNRPPLPESASRALFERAQEVGKEIGLGQLEAVGAGGGSDGNFTASRGTPTLDGLGAVGGGAHAEGEHVILSHLPTRTALLAALVDSLLHDQTL